MNKTAALVASAAILAACSTTPEVSRFDQSIEDYVEVGELEPVDSIRIRDNDSFTRLTDHYVLYDTRDGDYLLYFTRRCTEMRDMTRITPDQRRDNRLRRGFDTLRGCRIDEMYELTEAQAEEIGGMGDGR